MIRSHLSAPVRALGVWMVAMVLGGCLSAGAQAPAATSVPLTKAQAAAQARAQAAAQARANAAQARANAAQARAAARNANTQKRPLTTTTTTPAATTALTRPSTTAGTTTAGTSTTPRTAQTPASASSGTAGTGTLAWQTRVYTSTGCTHNGNSAVCTFTFVNQGNEATIAAGPEMSGIQLVDDAHVPHRANAAHFMDKYGEQQPRLLVQQGDTGTYVLVFPNVNPAVASGEFHLRQQIVGGISFSAAGTTSGTSASSGGAPTKPSAPK